MKRLPNISRVLLLSAGACVWVSSANALDLLLLSPDPMAEQGTLPAVSAPNGSWEFYAGMMSPGGAAFRGAGSLAVPLGNRFGAQIDVMGTMSSGGSVFGAAGHLFTRDPSQYMVGVTPAMFVSPDARLVAFGVEGEYYADRLSVEAWLGAAAIDYVNPASTDVIGFFAMGDVAYYPLDDLRLALGARTVLGDNSVRISGEYLLTDFNWPVSLVADAQMHAGGQYSIFGGIKGYFAPASEQKSLIDRHREDILRNRALDLFGSSLALVSSGGSSPVIDDPEYTACVLAENEFSTFPSSMVGFWNPEGVSGAWRYDDELDDCVFQTGGGGA